MENKIMITAKEFVDDLIKNGTEISDYDITDQVEYLFTEIKINFKMVLLLFLRLTVKLLSLNFVMMLVVIMQLLGYML